ncbi:transposase family protein [Streptomyces griseoluteus]|uniref:transposase family protein n=1 Tax=Streptomyces griseoluteus TaxID=29306 RepID=UPI0037FAEFCF
MTGVITASEPSWTAPFTGLSPRAFGKLITMLRREGADAVRSGRPWSLPLEDRVLLVAAYWRPNLTLRQLAPLFGISTSAVCRVVDHLGRLLALKQRQRFRKDTVLIVDGTLVPTRDHSIAEKSKNHRYSTNHQSSSMPTPAWSSPSGALIPHRRPTGGELCDWKEERNRSHKQVRARVEHVFARMKTWKIHRDCRLKGDGVHYAMLGIARLHNLNQALEQSRYPSTGLAPVRRRSITGTALSALRSLARRVGLGGVRRCVSPTCRAAPTPVQPWAVGLRMT